MLIVREIRKTLNFLFLTKDKNLTAKVAMKVKSGPALFRLRKIIDTTVLWERPLRLDNVDGIDLLPNKFHRPTGTQMQLCGPILTSADVSSLLQMSAATGVKKEPEKQ